MRSPKNRTVQELCCISAVITRDVKNNGCRCFNMIRLKNTGTWAGVQLLVAPLNQDLHELPAFDYHS